MLKAIYKSRFLIDEIEQSPYSGQFKALVNWALDEGYTPITVRNNFSGILHFIRWSAHRNVTPKTIRRDHVDRFLKLLLDESRSTVGGYGWAHLKSFLKSLQTAENSPLIDEPTEKIPEWINDHADTAAAHLRSVNGSLAAQPWVSEEGI